MMGDRTVMQEALFYGFSLESHVPQDQALVTETAILFRAE
jgi:hypothetical protein